MSHGGLVHADSGIGDRDCDILAGPHAQLLRREIPAQVDGSGFDRQLAPVRHGVARIHHQVHNHLLQPPRIGVYHVVRSGRDRHQVDIFADKAAQHLLYLKDQVVDVDRAGGQRLTPAEGEQLLRQRAAPFGGSADLFERGAERFAQVAAAEQQVAIPGNDGQQSC